MKILMVSMFSSHFFNWTEQLKDNGHEIYWLDVFDSNTRVEKIDFVHQIFGWRYKWNYPGRYLIKNKFPLLNKLINIFNERKLEVIFKKNLDEIKPDVVHSFVMFSGCVPIYKVMKKHPEIKWIYSAWGSDLFYYRKQQKHLNDINKVLPHINYMFSDCYRDYKLAIEHGFKGEFMGAFPGRGGFDFTKSNSLSKTFDKRNTILIKGYQGELGRCIPVLKAIIKLKNDLENYKLIVFGSDKEVVEFIEDSELMNWENLILLKKISEFEVLKLMGESLIYIGNSLSDGMPNTLLEAIAMDVFPIQSNPGGATEEIIIKGKNGLLIENPENVEEIRVLIHKAISDEGFLKSGIDYNFKNIKPKLERESVKKQVLEKYSLIEKKI